MDLKIEKKQDPAQCFFYENGIILPRVIRGEEPMWGLGGVCDSEGNFAESSAYDGGWAKHGGIYEWEQQEEKYVDGDVVYFGVFFRHWGHFLVDLIGRMWYPACSGEFNRNTKVAYLGEEEPDQNYLEFFKLLGVEPDQLIHVTRPLRCNRVIVPEMSARSCSWYTDAFIGMFDAVIRRVKEDEGLAEKYSGTDSVYFTRTSFWKAKETEFGEKQIERIFISNGYKSLAPEQLTLKEQIFLWNTAKRIVCLNGTIPLNAAFSQNKNLELLVLNKTSLFHGNPHLFLAMRSIKADFIDVHKEPFEKYPESLGAGPFLLHISPDLKGWLNEKKMRVPFRKKTIAFINAGNDIRYVFCILGIRKKTRAVISHIMPAKVKDGVRKLIKRK